ncbi:MAG: hypothetical protein ACJ8GW_14285 [Massilia sp.]
MLKQMRGLTEKVIVACLALCAMPGFAMQCPTYDLVPVAQDIVNMPGQFATWQASMASDEEVVFDLQAQGSMPRLFSGYLVLAIYRSSNAPHSYRLLAMQHKREIMKGDVQQNTDMLKRRVIDGKLVERLLAATTAAVLRTHYPAQGCSVLYTDGFYMRVSQTESIALPPPVSPQRTIQGQAFVPHANGADAPSYMLWQLGLALSEYAQGASDTKSIEARILALELAAKDGWD